MDILERLLIFMPQLDMLMTTECSVELVTDNFIAGHYKHSRYRQPARDETNLTILQPDIPDLNNVQSQGNIMQSLTLLLTVVGSIIIGLIIGYRLRNRKK